MINNNKFICPPKRVEVSFTMDPPAIIPFNFEIGKQLLSKGEATLDRAQVLEVQAGLHDYVANLDHVLRTLFVADNAKVARRKKQTSNVPVSFLYFRVQQQLLALANEQTLQKEKDMLSNLASLLDN